MTVTHDSLLIENNITGDVLLDLTHELLREMEINSVGERMRVLIAVKKLRKAMAHGRGGSARIGGEATPMKDRPAVAASATRKSPAGMSEVV